ALGLALVNSDVVGRLTLLAQGIGGNGSAWRGGAIDGVWRGMRPELRASVWIVATDASPASSGAASDGVIDLRGASGRVDYAHAFDFGSMRIGGGLSRAWLEWPRLPAVGASARSLAFADLSAGARRTGDGSVVSAVLRGEMNAGHTDGGPSFGRGILSLGVRAAGTLAPPIDLRATYGRVSARASSFER